MFGPPSYRLPSDPDRIRATEVIILRGTRGDDTSPVFNTQILALPRDQHGWIHALNWRVNLTGGATETRLTRARIGLRDVNERAQLFDLEAPNLAGRGVIPPWQTSECVAAPGVANTWGFNLPQGDMLVPGGTELLIWSTTTGAAPAAHGLSWSLILSVFPASNWTS